jgi:zinc protease
MRRLLKTVTIALLILAAAAAFAAESSPGFERRVLDNGLEVFVVENHVVPLVLVQITFRCGAIAQAPETAGVFHLYEHMMFKGNKVYRTQSDFQSAMKELGVSTWNGGTSTEYVTYYFTVPSDQLEKGIAFWANAVRDPLLDAGELETEKGVVANEINGTFGQPDDVFQAGVDRALYWKYPWRRDVSGSEKSIRAATVASLRALKDRYYVPNNAALFVGGDVTADAVLAAARKYLGDWQRGADPWAAPAPPHPGLPGDVRLVYADSQMYEGFAYAELEFRGPDVLADPASTYAADTWGKFLDDPNGRFKTSIFQKVPGLYKKEYIWASYLTQRDGGIVSFSTYLQVSKSKPTGQRVLELAAAIQQELSAMAADPGYFTDHDYQVLKAKLLDERVLERETAGGLISQLSFWWASSSTDYYLGYAGNLARTGPAEIVRWLQTWLIGKPSVAAVRLNPKDFGREKDADLKAGFAEITKDNAYWWAAAGK